MDVFVRIGIYIYSYFQKGLPVNAVKGALKEKYSTKLQKGVLFLQDMVAVFQ